MIGFFDSGVGGTTVLREVQGLLPRHDLLYLGDQARCPYGPRDMATLRQFSLENTQWLLARGAQFIVIPCNTASAAALHWLREEVPEVTFVGMVPALKPAALTTQSGVVGVLATPATMQGQLLRDVMAQWAEGITVVEQVGLGLVEAIEAGELTTPATYRLLEGYLRPMMQAGADTVVLGCTHYPYLNPLIQTIAPSLRIVDAAPAVARQVARVAAQLGVAESQTPTITYTTTGDHAEFAEFLNRMALPPGRVARAEGHPAVLEGIALN